MNKLLLIILLVAVGSLGFAQNPSKTLTRQKVGALVIGMTPDQVYDLVGKENTTLVDLYLEGTYSPALVLSESKGTSSSLVIEIVCDKVWRINAHDPIYKTEKGVGVGSTFGDLKKYHKVTSIEIGEGSVFAYVEDLNMSFCLDYQKAISEDLRIEDIGSSVKILKILIL